MLIHHLIYLFSVVNFYPLNLMFMKEIALKLTALSLSFLFSNITSAEELCCQAVFR